MNDNYILYPIQRFIDRYTQERGIRLHMPGHKGAYGYESDITEISGADELYRADGIIADSERATARLFGTERSYYSTEGSSQVIKAMCYLAINNYYLNGNTARPIIIAARNAHKAFINAAMLLRFDIRWICSESGDYSLYSCNISPGDIESCIESSADDRGRLAAVYITSPDYLGNILDVEGIAEVTHRYSLPLLCDNAHGAYLKFLSRDRHPTSLGADLVSDSAHKTLPVLTGGAYLHISRGATLKVEDEEVRRALLLFGSTSPSYMILESLDAAIGRIEGEAYMSTADYVERLKSKLRRMGYRIGRPGGYAEEPLKLTIDATNLQISGDELSDLLRSNNIECEYADRDYVVTMWSPYNRYPEDYKRFLDCMTDIWRKYSTDIYDEHSIHFDVPEVRYAPYEILYKPHYTASVRSDIIGKVVADTVISCPPAVLPVVAGEVISSSVVDILQYYGIDEIEVLR